MKMDIYKLYGYLSYLNYIIWLFLLNTLFCIVNIPFIVSSFILDLSLRNVPAFLLLGMTIGPSLYAVFDTIPVIDKGKGLIGHFFQSLKNKGLKALKIWAPMWALLVFLICDLGIIHVYGVFKPLRWGVLLLIALLITFIVNYFIVWTTWKQSIKEALVLTGKLALVKSVRYNVSLMILIGTFILMGFVPIYLVLYGAAIALFLAYKNFVPVINFVNDRPENQDQNESEE